MLLISYYLHNIHCPWHMGIGSWPMFDISKYSNYTVQKFSFNIQIYP